jgi:hypothetical protein
MDATTGAAPGVKVHAPGVYLGLDEAEYHDDPALGSSDVRNLLLSPANYWWASSLNPNRDEDNDKDTPATIRGTAIHKMVIEGEAAFGNLYACGPVHTADMSPSDKATATKAAKAKLAKNEPWKILLPAKDYHRVVIAASFITKNPALKTAFQGGLGEVSIFWDHIVAGTGDVVRCKARIDYLKPRGCGDLKSITNFKGIEFRRGCREAIANYRYDIQAAHYLEGRKALPLLVKSGLVFDPDGAPVPLHDSDTVHSVLIQRVTAEKSFAFQFVFFQAAEAPVTWSCIITPDENNPLYQVAMRDRALAIDAYVDHRQRFAPGEPWILLDAPGELDIESMPQWYARRE